MIPRRRPDMYVSLSMRGDARGKVFFDGQNGENNGAMLIETGGGMPVPRKVGKYYDQYRNTIPKRKAKKSKTATKKGKPKGKGAKGKEKGAKGKQSAGSNDNIPGPRRPLAKGIPMNARR